MQDKILFIFLAISIVIAFVGILVEIFLTSTRESTKYDKRLRVKRRDDGQLVALVTPALRVITKQNIFKKARFTYQASYDQKTWKDISEKEYNLFMNLDMVGDEYWRPISEGDLKEMLEDMRAD